MTKPFTNKSSPGTHVVFNCQFLLCYWLRQTIDHALLVSQ